MTPTVLVGAVHETAIDVCPMGPVARPVGAADGTDVSAGRMSAAAFTAPPRRAARAVATKMNTAAMPLGRCEVGWAGAVRLARVGAAPSMAPVIGCRPERLITRSREARP